MKEGIRPDEDKVNSIVQYPVPQNLQELRRFLGMAGFYRRFINSFSTIAKPLNQLTEKEKQFQWTDWCEEAFQQLKQCLVSAPILAFPNFKNNLLYKLMLHPLALERY